MGGGYTRDVKAEPEGTVDKVLALRRSPPLHTVALSEYLMPTSPRIYPVLMHMVGRETPMSYDQF